uniref:Uncharacterized protein n=1 Tax=Cannabis sativa TaxID=3483 RepID=A0A803Q1Q0_CANSA
MIGDSNKRNDELECEATAATAAHSDALPNQPGTSTRKSEGRPRDSKTKRHRETPRGNNPGNPQNPQDDQPGNTRDILVDDEGPQNPRNTSNRETQSNNPGTSCGNVQPENLKSSHMNENAKQTQSGDHGFSQKNAIGVGGQPKLGRPPRHSRRPNQNNRDNMYTYLSRGRVSNMFRRQRLVREEP